MKYRIYDTTPTEATPFGRFFTEEESIEVFKQVFDDGETCGWPVSSTDWSWEQTLEQL